MYLNECNVKCAFKRLSAKTANGKKMNERTSAIMYFLAFDLVAKQHGKSELDLSPKENFRKLMANEYYSLVVLGSKINEVKYFKEFGKIEIVKNSKCVEVKISSNFFTTRLKKASEISTKSGYPKRPVPLLLLGPGIVQGNWGITYSSNWEENLPLFFTDIQSNTPFTDLALLVCRNEEFDGNSRNLQEILSSLLKKKFTERVADFWSSRLNIEKIFVKHIDEENLLSEQYGNYNWECGNTRREELQSMNKAGLISRILDLENILDMNNISYDK